MRAWTVDADDIRVAEDFDESLLHRTPEIDGFLTPGPRRQVHRHRHQGLRQDAAPQGQAHPLPARRRARPACRAGNLLDKPIGDKIFGREALAVLRGVPAAVVEALAHRDRARDAQAPRRGRRPQGQRRGSRPDRRRAAPRRHRPLRPPPRLHAERAAARATDTDGHLVPRLRARQRAGGHLHRRRRRVLQQARRGRCRASPSVDRRAVAERLALRAARPRRGRLPAPPHQPSPEGLRGRAQGGVRAAAADARRWPSSTAAAPSTSCTRRRACARSSSTTSAWRRRDRMVRPERLRDDPLEAFLGRTDGHRTSTPARRRTPSTTSAGTRCSGRAT